MRLAHRPLVVAVVVCFYAGLWFAARQSVSCAPTRPWAGLARARPVHALSNGDGRDPVDRGELLEDRDEAEHIRALVCRCKGPSRTPGWWGWRKPRCAR